MGGWLPRPISRNQQDIVFHTQLGVTVTLERLEVHNEIVFDGKDRVTLEVWVVVGKDLICYGLVVIVADLLIGGVISSSRHRIGGTDDGINMLGLPYHEVYVCGPHWMAVHHVQEHACRTFNIGHRC